MRLFESKLQPIISLVIKGLSTDAHIHIKVVKTNTTILSAIGHNLLVEDDLDNLVDRIDWDALLECPVSCLFCFWFQIHLFLLIHTDIMG